MGNYTSIEKEFNTRIDASLKELFASQPDANNSPNIQQQANALINKTLLEMRNEKMQSVCSITHRKLICYI